MKEINLKVEGMMCGNCEKHVKNALEALDGELVDLCDAVLCEAEYFGADTDDARESFAWLVADYEAVTGSAPGVSERGPDKGGETR